jgi:hypothetical protein
MIYKLIYLIVFYIKGILIHYRPLALCVSSLDNSIAACNNYKSFNLTFKMILQKLTKHLIHSSPKPLSAYKYLRSISETALLYRPIKLKNLDSC